VKVYLVNDHDCGRCGRILGAFDEPGKAEALIARYRAADDADVWPEDLPFQGMVQSLEVEEWEVA
jgi:hypothetical protein